MPGKEHFGLTGENFTLFEKHMTAGKAFLFQKKEIRHMKAPFDSLILECPVFVVMTSKNDIARVEYVLVLMLLQQFEAHILG